MNHDLKREANNFSFSDPLLNNRFKLAKQTLNELIVNCDDYGVTFISIRAIALNTGKSTPTIQNHIEILESLGVLKTLDIKGNFGKKSHRQISFNVQVDVKPNVQVDVQVDVKPNVQVDVQVAYTEEKIREDKIIEEQTASLLSVVTLTQSREVAQYLKDAILEIQPTAKTPSDITSWAKDIEKAIRIDNRDAESLMGCIDWVFREHGKTQDFWKPNIRSGAKLRDKYDQLELQAQGK